MSVPTNDIAAALRQKRMQRFLLVTGAIIVLAGAYGSGMRSQKKVLGASQNQLKQVRQDLRFAQLTLQGRDLLLQQLEARRQVSLAADAARAQNFGVARQHLADAATRLETTQTIEAAAIADLSKAITPLKKLSADNANVPSPDRLDEIARAMDTALNAVAPAPDAITRITIKPPTANDVPLYPEIGR